MSEQLKIKGVILVSFEYPPRKLTAASEAIDKLSVLLAKNKIKTTVITFDDWRSGIEKRNKYLNIHRIPYPITNNISFLAMVMNLKPSYQSAITAILHTQEINIIHFFEWMSLLPVIPWDGIITIKKVYSTSSIQDRRDPIHNPYNDGIRALEKLGFDAINFVISNSKQLTDQIIENYKVMKNDIESISYTNKKYAEKAFDLYQKLLVEKTKGG